MRRITLCLGLLAALLSAWMLERAHRGLEVRHARIGDTPVTYMLAERTTPAGWIVVSHGFAGSRQMMDAISTTIARTGLGVMSFDDIGHGRHPDALSPEIADLDGTTAQLLEQLLQVIDAAPGPVVGLVGHSMATDLILRAGEAAGIGRLVAVSMYSETITPDWPPALLVVSGQWEGRLRDAALAAVRQVDPAAREGEIARAGDVVRLARVAPLVGHVGVLWSPTTLAAARDWLSDTVTPLARTGPWIALLLGAWIVVGRTSMALAMRGPRPPQPPLPPAQFWLALLVPLPVALGLGYLLAGLPVLGLTGFAPVGLALSALGFGWLGLSRFRPARPGKVVALYALWAIVFALLLDRYGAAFLPTGPRAVLMLMLLPATLSYALGEAALLVGASLWRRILVRTAALALLGALMALAPARIGLTFTILPVLFLFWLVFGTVARPIVRRAPFAAALGLGGALAWAIAASTPLFAV